MLRLAMLGMIPGNGHPYSWSAIINGYDREVMEGCPYAAIPRYLGANPPEAVRIPQARVTHIWTEDRGEAEHVARAALIPHVVASPEEVIGAVDGVIISTDDGTDHTRRVRPFVEAGLPVFVDKPLATTRTELAQFAAWKRAGARFLSSSGLRYAPELSALQGRPWRWLTATTIKTWERYGIHALEPLIALLGSGLETVSLITRDGFSLATLTHRSGTPLTIAVLPDAPGSFGVIHAYGNEDHTTITLKDTYTAFRNQLVAAIEWMHNGLEPHPFSQTLEMMAALIAGIESRETGLPVSVQPLLESLSTPG